MNQVLKADVRNPVIVTILGLSTSLSFEELAKRGTTVAEIHGGECTGMWAHADPILAVQYLVEES